MFIVCTSKQYPSFRNSYMASVLQIVILLANSDVLILIWRQIRDKYREHATTVTDKKEHQMAPKTYTNIMRPFDTMLLFKCNI